MAKQFAQRLFILSDSYYSKSYSSDDDVESTIQPIQNHFVNYKLSNNL